jgi:CubicO group peptidase (beta-lactamase class C family)
MQRRAPVPLIFVLGVIGVLAGVAWAGEPVWPGKQWTWREPADVGLKRPKLEDLSKAVSGRGCVVRGGAMVYSWGDQRKSGDVASAMKPLLSVLMLMAVEEGKIASVDEPLVRWEAQLSGKDALITWRHLASQNSGYGLIERPGEAWGYNDFALALYYDMLMGRVYQSGGTDVLRRQIAAPLGFEDAFTFEAFGPRDRPGRLAVSVRDFARFGLMAMRGGKWADRQIVNRELLEMSLRSVVPVDLPRTSGREAAMLPGQRSLGGTRNITPDGPGQYSFNWWLNRKNPKGQRLFESLPEETFAALGHGGARSMILVPNWDLIVVWNDAPINQMDSPLFRQAQDLIAQAAKP